ncbi:hypothetical protein AMECASPLE_013824 [Ameca splendens]|uniref:Uncharacterized protein n=1 Tax=Ameca splendens TaxID=208324 RepID=A0ABV0Y1V4_9TELE
MLGQSVRLQPVPIQNLSELERARLQDVALYHLEERDLDFKISIPREIRKRRKSLRRRFDSFSKEKKERGKWMQQIDFKVVKQKTICGHKLVSHDEL